MEQDNEDEATKYAKYEKEEEDLPRREKSAKLKFLRVVEPTRILGLSDNVFAFSLTLLGQGFRGMN